MSSIPTPIFMIGFTAVLAVIGFVMHYKNQHGSFGEFIGMLLAVFFSCGFAASILFASVNQKTEKVTYVTPTIIARSDKHTIVSYQDQAVVSDKAEVYISPDTNIFIKVTEYWNYWDVKLSGSNKKLVVGKD